MKKNNLFFLTIFALFLLIFGLIVFVCYFEFRKNENDLENKNPKEIATLKSVSFITPHHLFAKDLIENIFQNFSNKNKGAEIERVILISPNHFNLGHAPVIISDVTNGQGEIRVDKINIEKLLKNTAIFEKEKESDKKDHGVYNIIPYVARYFPGIPVIPLMIRDGISQERIGEIEEVIKQNFNEKTILILSSDFSHYVGWETSRIHDRESIKAISQMDMEAVDKLDMDCRGGLRILLDYSKERKYFHFNFLENSSSSEIVGRDMEEKNTSYVTGYFSQE